MHLKPHEQGGLPSGGWRGAQPPGGICPPGMGICLPGVCLDPPQDTVNWQAVHILLECILVIGVVDKFVSVAFDFFFVNCQICQVCHIC